MLTAKQQQTNLKLLNFSDFLGACGNGRRSV